MSRETSVLEKWYNLSGLYQKGILGGYTSLFLYGTPIENHQNDLEAHKELERCSMVQDLPFKNQKQVCRIKPGYILRIL